MKRAKREWTGGRGGGGGGEAEWNGVMARGLRGYLADKDNSNKLKNVRDWHTVIKYVNERMNRRQSVNDRSLVWFLY